MATTGHNPDADGYAVSLDGGAPRTVATSGSVTFSSVAAGRHTVALTGLAANCSTDAPRADISVSAGATARAAFAVTCPGGTIAGTVTPGSGALSRAPAAALRDALTELLDGETAGPPSPSVSAKLGAAGWELPPPAWSGRIEAGGRRDRLPVLYAPGELVVQFQGVAVPDARAAYASPREAGRIAEDLRGRLAPRARLGGARYRVEESLPFLRLVRVRVEPGEDLEAVADELRRLPGVRRVERPALSSIGGTVPWPAGRGGEPSTRPLPGAAKPHPSPVAASRPIPGLLPATHPRADAASLPVIPGDPLYPLQAWHAVMMDLPRAWQRTTTSANILVAVVDDGITPHGDIVGQLTNDGFDFVSDQPVPLCGGGGVVHNAGDGDGPDPDPTQPLSYLLDPENFCVGGLNPDGNHGLFVAGVIGATGNDGFGTTGVTWSVRIRPVRVMGVSGTGSHFDILQGVAYAAGVAVPLADGSTVQVPAADIINLSLGGPVQDPFMPELLAAVETAGVTVVAAAGNDASAAPLFPASNPTVLSVGALSPTFTRASYSNFAPTVDVYAPGGETAFGFDFGVFSAVRNYVAGDFEWEGLNGTSFAAPGVTGLAALLLASEPGLPPAELRRRIRDFAVATEAGPSVNARNTLTATPGPGFALFVRAVDATTGATVATATVAAGGAYALEDLPPGEYRVYAGGDEEGDGILGVPLRLWGALGGAATPRTVTLVGSERIDASFSVGLPAEAESNGTVANADVLALEGYLLGRIPQGDLDVFEVRIPTAGTYTFETTAPTGACGFALGEDTILRVLDEDGMELAANDDIDDQALLLCSRATLHLAPGRHFVTVEGYQGGRNGTYAVTVRAGT